MMSITSFDYSLFQSVNDLAGRFPVLDAVMRFLAQDAEYFFYLGVVLYWFTRSETNRKMVVQAGMSACSAFGIGMLLSHLFYRDRPFVAHHVQQLIDHAANASLPSDHAIGSFVIAASIWLYRKRDGSVWLLLAACIAFSRIWTGVHYPLDVAAGAGIGVLAAVGAHGLFVKSGLLRKWMTAGIAFYERAERRVWPSRTS
ncbi:undecaprenyl-diphosphatase [Paenibacillus sp. MBLB4367]|uniref:undecaprenyl-diphosphatase n=1 Tax=Paenibacillus sp. MBLB4367 TaxID=3384767 RepID=UPI003907FC82